MSPTKYIYVSRTKSLYMQGFHLPASVREDTCLHYGCADAGDGSDDVSGRSRDPLVFSSARLGLSPPYFSVPSP